MRRDYALAYAALYQRHWWWRSRERMLVNEIAAIAATFKARPIHILDVGCGPAVMFDELSRFGKVRGVEPDAALVELSGLWRSSISVGSLDDTYRPEDAPAIIIMGDVLEHVLDDVAMLRRAREIVECDGYIIITVPAFNWLWTNHDTLNAHVRRYSARSLADAATRAGLRVVRHRYLFQGLVPAKLVVRMKELITGTVPGLPRVPYTAINVAANWWCWYEYRFCGSWAPLGSSLLAICVPGEGVASGA